MKIIECISEDIEASLEAAEKAAERAVMYKEEYPVAARAFYNKSAVLMDSIKPQHEAIVALIENYKKEKGEAPAPMMAIYEYTHKKQIMKAAAVKILQEMFTK